MADSAERVSEVYSRANSCSGGPKCGGKIPATVCWAQDEDGGSFEDMKRRSDDVHD